MDFTLSFLDSYVSAALETGSEPYKPRGLLHTALNHVQGLCSDYLLTSLPRYLHYMGVV